ncbi:MEMO1 family [Flagelloscypha sp. PMI_526]|nr:MEMO1 family [Flagelloscypha sp. PMI_526]
MFSQVNRVNPDVRRASHAGSWYTADAQTLDGQLTEWLDVAVAPEGDEPFPVNRSKAIIAPYSGCFLPRHAGYTYSGPTAAWAYKSIDTTGIKRVFILGPAHHIRLRRCALSACKTYQTPIGDLPLDLETIAELHATNQFDVLSIKNDEAEHSIEMHLSYVRKVFEGQDIKIVPIVVGAISQEIEADFGALLAPHLQREDTFTVISSDFCHWGPRFNYMYYYSSPTSNIGTGTYLQRDTTPSPSHAIHQSIQKLDREGMNILTMPPSTPTAAHDAFETYLRKTENTICGRHPIGVLLGVLSALEREHTQNVEVGGEGEDGVPEKQSPSFEIKWVKYAQSEACQTARDESVSYASAWVRF